MENIENKMGEKEIGTDLQSPVVIAKTTKNMSVPTAIIIASIIIGLSLIVAFSGSGKTKTKTKNGKLAVVDPTAERSIEPVTKRDHIRGDLSKAKVAIIEFSDTECPYCKQIHPTLIQLTAHYVGDVAWVYRYMPLENIHPKSRMEAHGAECVFEQGGNDAFWKYIDEIFVKTPANNGLDPAELPKIAQSVGVDVTKWQACQDSKKYMGIIDADLEDATLSGAQGTPDVTVINLKTGEAIHAGADPSTIVQVIDRILKK